MTPWIVLGVFLYVVAGNIIAGLYASNVWDRGDRVQWRILLRFVFLGPAYLVREKIFRRGVV